MNSSLTRKSSISNDLKLGRVYARISAPNRLENAMPTTPEVRVILEREMCAVQKRLAVLAHRLQARFAGPDVEADDLFQEGMIGAYRQLHREMVETPEDFDGLGRDALQEIILRIASRVMRNKICDGHRRSYRRIFAAPADDMDDRLREALSARDDLQAIEAALTGPSLALFRLLLQHGQDDVPALASAIDRSVAQTYRLLHGLKVTARQVAGRTPEARLVSGQHTRATSLAQSRRAPGSAT
jgi:DNA-directed RNA polymerase specialized sigma24 family protein